MWLLKLVWVVWGGSLRLNWKVCVSVLSWLLLCGLVVKCLLLVFVSVWFGSWLDVVGILCMILLG